MSDILIVAESETLREGVRSLLVREGYGARIARSGSEGMRKLGVRRPDLLLLEPEMSRMSGLKICELIRRADRLLPVIFLSPQASTDEHLRAFALGADDYVAELAGGEILLARIRRALARMDDFDGSEAVVTIGKVTVGLETLTVRGGRTLKRLTRTERDILMLLVQHANTYVTRSQLATALRGQDYVCARGLIYSHVYNLRRKLGPAGDALICDRRIGYRLDF